MSKYSDYLKRRKDHDLEYFLGQEPKHISNKYITVNNVLDEDNIQICKFTSVWDGGDKVTTNATVNLYTNEVIAERTDPDDLGYECNILDNEFITMKNGTTHQVYLKDDCNPKENFWYR